MIRKTRSLRPLAALAVAFFLMLPALDAQVPVGQNRGEAKLDIDGKIISLNYGRPKLQGRDWTTVKVGTIWRLGMNQATTINLPMDIYTCCGVVKAGAYSLWAKKTGPDKWEMIFNSQTGQWGTSHDPLKDVLSVPMKLTSSKENVEQLTIALVKTAKGGEIHTTWGKQELVMEFSTKA